MIYIKDALEMETIVGAEAICIHKLAAMCAPN